MLSVIGAAPHVLLAVLALATSPEPDLLAIAVVAVATLTALVVSAHMLGLPIASGRSVTHPRTQIGVSTRLAQSDPDAAGHPRPRAPGHAAPAA